MPSKTPAQARLMVPCQSCGKERFYSLYDVRRERHKKPLCQSCGTKAYNATRTKQPKSEKRAKQARWVQKNMRRLELYGADYRDKIKREMVSAYGGQCIECGETDYVVLVLDHVADDAQEDRRKNRHSGGYKMYLGLRRRGWPKGQHQLLCHNCNFRKEYARRKNAVRVGKAA